MICLSYLEYQQKYGEEKARHLISALYGRYDQALLVITPGMKNIEYYRQQVSEIADFFGWEIAELEGNVSLLEAVLKGQVSKGVIYVEAGRAVKPELFCSR